ncbi:MAG: OstA-like protein [Candidatus Omnitrophica bacterium]|nr:OstA-like protein [Candidatus Omnitrophota bacterium]MDD5310534.1 OstA-like protein [Candidatus Omnitrophota bacterium]MDD5546040.1 OstA-like protein [Candidatus Omnitrophota bacterium]
MSRKFSIIAFAVIITFILPGMASGLDVATPKFPTVKVDKNTKEPVVINGDTVEYSETDMTAVANGNVVITYQDAKLTCKKAIFHTDTKEVLAEGDVKLTQEGSFLKGEQMVYNVETKVGTIVNPRVFIEPTYYGAGQKAEKQDENHYYIRQGFITTCDREKPHYRVQTKQLNVYLNDRVTAKNILVLVGDVPVFYFPYLSIPLKDFRSPVSVMAGHDNDWGYYLLTSWKYYLNEKVKGRINIDYRELRDFAYGFSTNYDTDDFGSGVVRFNYFDERSQRTWSTRAADEQDKDLNRYRAQLRHKWQPDTATSGIVEYNKLSDANVMKDYYLRDFQKDMVNNNYASLIRTDPYYTTSLFVQPRVNRFDSVVEYLPQVQFQTRSLKIGQTNFYYDGQAAAANINKLEPAPVNGVASVNRVDTTNQLSYQSNILGWLGIRPFAGTEQTYYSKDMQGDNSNFIRGNFFTGIDLNTRFYKTYDVKSNAFNMEINNIRHVFSPTVSYYYAHRPTFRPANLAQFDSIDALDFRNVITPSLENKLQTKRMVGKTMQTVDLARLIVSTNYNFRAGEKKKGRVGDYDFLFESKPYNWMRILSTTSYDQHTSKFNSFTFNIVGDPEYNLDNPDLRGTVYTDLTRKKWSWGAGYRWQDEVYSQLEGQLMFNLTDKWKITAYERIDFKRFGSGADAAKKFINKVAEQEYRISRDLHCWVGDIICNISEDHGYTFMFALRLKAFPEMPFEFQQNYNPPRFGSTLPPG